MKNVILGLAVSAALVSGVASAADVSAEWRSGSNNTNLYNVEANGSLGPVKLLTEAETTQAKGSGTVDSQLFAAGVGFSSTIVGFSYTPFVQVVRKLNTDAEAQSLVGAGLKVSHDLVGPISVDAEYRYRDVVSGPAAHENREKLGLTWDVTKNNAVSANFFEYSGTAPSYHSVGVNFRHTF